MSQLITEIERLVGTFDVALTLTLSSSKRPLETAGIKIKAFPFKLNLITLKQS